MEFESLIFQELKKTLNKKVNFSIETPSQKNFGDFSSNVAFILAKEKKKNPNEIAKEILKNLKKSEKIKKYFEKIEIKNGFLNFFLKKEVLLKEIKKILKEGKNYPKFRKSNKKIILEFISANPTGFLTLGNARGGFLGDTLAKILKKVGYKVTSEYYINNAKTSKQIKELGKTALGESKSYLTNFLKEKIKKENLKIKKITKKFKKDKEKIYQEVGFLLAKKIQKENKKFIEKKLKIKFDNWFSEQSLYSNNKIKKLLEILKRKKVVYEKENALWLKTSKYGEKQDWVIVRKDGTPTYFLNDLCYHLEKEKRGFDLFINIWGADHYSHIARLKVGLKILGISPEKLKVILVQIVRQKTEKGVKKISKRKGIGMSLETLINEIGLDTARFFFLRIEPNSHLDFDLKLAKEKSNRNPLYYIRYAYVRAISLLKKAGNKKYQSLKFDFPKEIENEFEEKLLREIIKYPQIIKEISKNYSCHYLINYSFELAKNFHQFYEKTPVLNSNSRFLFFRISLVEATKIILENCFDLIKISLPKKM